MSNEIQVKRLDGGVLCPSISWKGLVRNEDGVTTVSSITGSGPRWVMQNELQALRGVRTNWGLYKSHTLAQGMPGVYDQVTVIFQTLTNPPVYMYDFDAPTANAPLQDHPSYKAFWDYNLVAKGKQQLSTSALDSWQAITAVDPATSNASIYWQKSTQQIPKGLSNVTWNGVGDDPASGHKSGKAFKKGVTQYTVPAISIREIIYFVEKKDYTFNFLGTVFTAPALNTKTISSMSGKAGWPLYTTFGYPHDTYSLLNNPTITIGGISYTTNYTDYLNVGVTASGSNVAVTEAFYKEKGIPTTAYINTTNYPLLSNGIFKGSTFGHPLWICKSCRMKKIGYWYEATLVWSYYPMGIDADLYPLATARILGFA